MAYKTSSMISNNKKLRMKKFNPAKNKHEWFVESKLPKHTK
jgi:large subunit ribosomal protein L33